jgi:exopolyphosphatase/guanosine-5'-triphosphate,3'-diphosphate pyrophosphatase
MSARASIDIGTNSALLLIAETDASGIDIPRLQKARTPRVGAGVGQSGLIAESNFEELLQVLEEFSLDIAAAGAELRGVAATEAFRKADNGPELLARVQQETGWDCRILSSREEARLTYRAVAQAYRDAGLHILDLGGGSLEWSWAEGSVSVPLGAVVLTEKFGNSGDGVYKHALKVLQDSAFPVNKPWVLVGGTATALALLDQSEEDYSTEAVEGYELKRGNVEAWCDAMDILETEERAELPGLDLKRAEILPAGARVLLACMEVGQIQSVRTSDRGLRYGLLLDSENLG